MFIPLHDQNALTRIHLQYVTLIVIAVNVCVWLLTATPQLTAAENANALYYSFGFIPAVINDLNELPADLIVLPETTSYLTYGFLHADFMHLAGNMLFLWVFGDNVEDALGHFRFLIFYTLCLIAGAWAHGFFAPASEAPLVGASGAIAGIVGAYLLLHPKVKIWILAFGRIPLRLSALWVLSAWILFQVFNFLNAGDGEVSWAAHIGGIVAGMVLLPLLKKRDAALFDRNLPEPSAPQSEPQSKANPSRWGRQANPDRKQN